MASVFIKVPVIERLPNESGLYITNNGVTHFLSGCKRWGGVDPLWYLEEIELPTDGQIYEQAWHVDYSLERQVDFKDGANFILDKLKGGKKDDN